MFLRFEIISYETMKIDLFMKFASKSVFFSAL